MEIFEFEPCPLCKSSKTTKLLETYLHCEHCDLRFLHPNFRLTPEQEKARYLEHNNDVTDVRYQNFIQPLCDEIIKRKPVTATGLDFGAGTGPIGAELLKKRGYCVSVYDPFFWPDPKPLAEKYDFVLSTEVVEHFFDPAEEFQKLRALLKSEGLLAIMTLLYQRDTHFDSWYYRKDPTHVVFYSQKTFQWIQSHYGFKEMTVVGDRMIILTTA